MLLIFDIEIVKHLIILDTILWLLWAVYNCWAGLEKGQQNSGDYCTRCGQSAAGTQ